METETVTGTEIENGRGGEKRRWNVVDNEISSRPSATGDGGRERGNIELLLKECDAGVGRKNCAEDASRKTIDTVNHATGIEHHRRENEKRHKPHAQRNRSRDEGK